MVLSWVARGVVCVSVHDLPVGVCNASISVINIQGFVAWLLNFIGILGVALLLPLLNKDYSFVRSVTYVFSSTYMLMGIACPYMLVGLSDGVIMCLVTLFAAGLLFGIYQSRLPQRRVFLISVILSVCCMYNYTYVYLIPVFFVGFLQMRAMSIRSVLAMILGLITPFWIALGMGLIDFSDFQPPRWETMWSEVDWLQSGVVILTMATTAFFTIVLLVRNVLQIINYKMQIRAYNGFFLVLTVFTMFTMLVDYGNIFTYLPMLNLCFAIQMAHAFTIKKYLRRYLLYLLFVVLCIAIYMWLVFY